MNNLSLRSAQKARYDKLKEQGLCVTCATRPGYFKADGTRATRCRRCMDRQFNCQQALRARRKAKGLCIECGNPADLLPSGRIATQCFRHAMSDRIEHAARSAQR